jgi:MFS family permease
LKTGHQGARLASKLALCTAMSLFGDATLYAVLPSQYGTAGVTAFQVGWLLSINRLVRLPLNVPSGWLSDRLGRKRPYVAGLILGALSTLGYGLYRGFWPLAVFRVLWGVAWALLIVSAYGMILDVSTEDTRGRYMGLYGAFSFFGGAFGAMLGGALVDAFGFSSAMLVAGGCTSLACVLALTLPDTQQRRPCRSSGDRDSGASLSVRLRTMSLKLRRLDTRLWLILWLNLAYRFVFAGVFYSTLGLYLVQVLGNEAMLGTRLIGVASLTGALLFARTVVTLIVAPSTGYLSDRLGDRRLALLLGETVGALGLVWLARGGSVGWIAAGVLLVAGGSAVVPSMLVAWMGDVTDPERRATLLGSYQTMGDLGSGLGPPVAYALVELLGVQPVYALAAGLVALTIPVILRTSK